MTADPLMSSTLGSCPAWLTLNTKNGLELGDHFLHGLYIQDAFIHQVGFQLHQVVLAVLLAQLFAL